jgi:S1-C subfamily serine protease
MAVKIANQEAQPKFTQSPMPDMGMIASLATPAECDAIGLPPDQGCFRVTGLLPRRASELAGFQVGDAMLQVNDFKATRELKLADVEKMMEDVLRGRMGKELKIIVQRNGKRLELTLQVTSK